MKIFKTEIIKYACEKRLGELDKLQSDIFDNIIKKKNSGVMGWFRKIFKKPFTKNDVKRIHLPDNWGEICGDMRYCETISKFTYEGLYPAHESTMEVLGLKGDCLECDYFNGKCSFGVEQAGEGWTCLEWVKKWNTQYSL